MLLTFMYICAMHDIYEKEVYVKLKRLQWIGHVVRMDGKRVLMGCTVGKRPKCRPRKRWEYTVAVDARVMLGVRGWKSTVRELSLIHI